MTIYYIDPTRPTNGDGSIGSPYNVHPAITANNSYLFKSGTTYVPATEIYANNVDNVIFDTYDWTFGSAGKPVIDAQGAFNGINLRSVDNAQVNNLNFISSTKAAGGYCGVNIAGTSAKASSNITVNNCSAKWFSGVGLYAQNYGNSLTDTLINIVFNVCYATENRTHNLGMYGGVGTGCEFNRCISDGAGRTWSPVSPAFGAHGFTSLPRRYYADTTAWALTAAPGGTTYKSTNVLASYAKKVYLTYGSATGGDTPASNVFHIVTKNTTTPTTPAQGEFGVDGNDVYVNAAWGDYTPPQMAGVIVISTFAGITHKDCISFDTRDISTVYGEGHGFSADDTSNNNTYIRCVSYGNEGNGFMSIAGDDLTYIGCVSMYNDTQNRNTSAYKLVLSKNAKYIHCTGGLSQGTNVLGSEYTFYLATYTVQNSIVLREAIKTSSTGIAGANCTVTKALRGNVYYKTGDANATADEAGSAIPIVFKNNPSPTNVDFTLDESCRALSNCPFAPESAGITSITGELFNKVGTSGAYTLPFINYYREAIKEFKYIK